MATGKKYDGDKAPLVQGCLAYFPAALNAVAMVSKFGKEKYQTTYAERNWYQLDDAENRYTDALARHLVRTPDDLYDEESQLLHAAHAAWDALARLELLLSKSQVFLSSGKPNLLELQAEAEKRAGKAPRHPYNCVCDDCLPF